MSVENGKRKCRRRFKFNLLIFSCCEIIKLELLLSAWVIYAQMVNLNSLHTSSGLHRAEERKSGPTQWDEKFWDKIFSIHVGICQAHTQSSCGGCECNMLSRDCCFEYKYSKNFTVLISSLARHDIISRLSPARATVCQPRKTQNNISDVPK